MHDLLLLTLLSQIQLLTEKVGQTDWPTVWIGAAFSLLGALATLGGAWIGASRGAKAGYEASLKAGTQLVRREKLEEILSLLEAVHFKEGKLIAEVGLYMKSGRIDEAKALVVREKVDFSILSRFRLKTLVEVYFETASGYADSIYDVLYEFVQVCWSLEAIKDDADLEQRQSMLSNLQSRFLDSSQSLKEAVINELKKGVT